MGGASDPSKSASVLRIATCEFARGSLRLQVVMEPAALKLQIGWTPPQLESHAETKRIAAGSPSPVEKETCGSQSYKNRGRNKQGQRERVFKDEKLGFSA